jgi:hypothetical protein
VSLRPPVNDAVLHHEYYPLERPNVLQRITVDSDEQRVQIADAVVARGLERADRLEQERRLVDLELPCFLPFGGWLVHQRGDRIVAGQDNPPPAPGGKGEHVSAGAGSCRR